MQRIMQAVADIRPDLDQELLKEYLNELFAWNPQLGLVSKKDPERTVKRLIRLSINLWEYTEQVSGLGNRPEGLQFLDIGTGGGFTDFRIYAR